MAREWYGYVNRGYDPKDPIAFDRDDGIFALKGPKPYVDATHPAYGAVGDGANDDTSAFQAALNEAIAVDGTLVIPPPSSYYKITSQLLIQPASGSEVSLNILGPGGGATIQWDGGNDTSVFRSLGYRRSSVNGVNIKIPAGKSGMVAWEVDVAATPNSSAYVSWRNCDVDLSAAGNDCIGWRLGHAGGATGGTEMSSLMWDTCLVAGKAASTGQYGWVNEHSNGVLHTWLNSEGWDLDKMYSDISTAGAAAAQGGVGHTFIGCGGSSNSIDFERITQGPISIIGGRWETGTKFVYFSPAFPSAIVNVLGVELSAYPANQVFHLDGHPAILNIDGIRATGTDHGASLIDASGQTSQIGVISVRNSKIRATTDPIYALSGSGTFAVNLENNQKVGSDERPTAMFKTRRTVTDAVFETHGTGSPESVVTAGIGSRFYRTDGGAGTSFYVKESGTGNTGWVAK